MTERRFDEDEVAAIFARAVDGPPVAARHTAADSGLTLAELQEIGREAGIEPDAIARAVREIAAGGQAMSRRMVGLPIGVERTIPLERPLSDAQWDHLVVTLRETFNARGQLSGSGAFRQWVNGNLQALVEPIENGQRVRLRTYNGQARRLITVGLVAIGASGAVALAGLAGGHLARSLSGVVTLLAIGVGLIGWNVFRLPGWARERARQMQAIEAALPLLGRPSEPRALPPDRES